MLQYNFKKLNKDEINWSIIETTPDSTIYKTSGWFEYLHRWKAITPMVVEISTDHVVGYFVGELFFKGVTILGSPFEGLGTGHQGLSMLTKISTSERLEIYKHLSAWVFDQKIASYIQIEDYELTMADIADEDIVFEGHDGYMIDLIQSEEALFRNLHPRSCRYRINKSIKSGIFIRETSDVNRFIDVYYHQLEEVFNKQGLTPTYDKSCVKALVDALYPNHILLLEAVTAEGEIAATGLFPGEKNMAIFWGGASYQKFQYLCPNEPLIWEAIRLWKVRGAKVFDLCGVRPYKLKFGPTLYTKPKIMFARYPVLISAKCFMKKMYYGIRSFKAKFRK